MKKTRFTEIQIVSILKQHENGLAIKDICREQGISEATFYNWKNKYGGMEASDVKRLKDLEEEASDSNIFSLAGQCKTDILSALTAFTEKPYWMHIYSKTFIR